MNKNLVISVIIPAYNCESTITQTLNSVINQTIKNIEIILINNNSSDNTLKKVNEICDERIKILKCKKQSPAATRNKGIKNAKADIIAFLDADDIWFKDKLEKSLIEIEKYDFVYHDLYLFKKILFNHQYRGIVKTRNFKNPVKRDLILNGNGINTSSVVVKKDLLYKAGLFDENKNLFAAEDYDLWIRVSDNTERFKKINEILGIYLITGNNITNYKRRYIYTKELIKKNIEYVKKEFGTDMVPWMAYNMITSGFKNNNHTNFKIYFEQLKNKPLTIKKKIIVFVIYSFYLIKNKLTRFKNFIEIFFK